MVTRPSSTPSIAAETYRTERARRAGRLEAERLRMLALAQERMRAVEGVPGRFAKVDVAQERGPSLGASA